MKEKMYKDNKVYKKSIEFLVDKNADKVDHSGGTFLEHLIGVAEILEDWDCSFDTVMAGMFHNIYGNKHYDPNLNITREEVKKLIGEKSENLAWTFKNTDREKIIDLKNLDLLLIRLANEYEQNELNFKDFNKDIKALISLMKGGV